MIYLAWALSFVYLVALTLPIPLAVFVLAISPAKAATFKRMLFLFITVAPAILLIGFVLAGVSHSHAVAKLTGMFCVPLGLLAAAIAGWKHARSMRKQETPALTVP